MQVTCPNCSAGYEVPDRLLSASGRRLRCARCASEFRASLSDTAAMAIPVDPIPIFSEPPVLRAPERTEQPPAPHIIAAKASPRHRLRAALQVAMALLAWTGSLGFAGSAGYLAISQRAHVMAAWAPSVRAYQAIGLATPPKSTNAVSASAQTAAPEAPAMSPPESHPG